MDEIHNPFPFMNFQLDIPEEICFVQGDYPRFLDAKGDNVGCSATAYASTIAYLYPELNYTPNDSPWDLANWDGINWAYEGKAVKYTGLSKDKAFKYIFL